MRAVIQREVSRIKKRIIDAKLQMVIATSGTPAALSGLYAAKVRGYDESKPHTVPRDCGRVAAGRSQPPQPGATAVRCAESAHGAPRSSLPAPWSLPS